MQNWKFSVDKQAAAEGNKKYPMKHFKVGKCILCFQWVLNFRHLLATKSMQLKF